MHIALLHTSDVHVETFNNLIAQIDAAVEVTHRVRPDLLDRAQVYGVQSVRNATGAELQALATADAVICTCSTLGPIVDEIAQTFPHILRIDRPMMERACHIGPHITVAICLDSTRAATLALLQKCAADLGRIISPRLVLCQSAWPYFETGDMQGFAANIADTVIRDHATTAPSDCIVLAQASMQRAQAHLVGLGIPVLSSPQLAAEFAIAVASSSKGTGGYAN